MFRARCHRPGPSSPSYRSTAWLRKSSSGSSAGSGFVHGRRGRKTAMDQARCPESTCSIWIWSSCSAIMPKQTPGRPGVRENRDDDHSFGAQGPRMVPDRGEWIGQVVEHFVHHDGIRRLVGDEGHGVGADELGPAVRLGRGEPDRVGEAVHAEIAPIAQSLLQNPLRTTDIEDESVRRVAFDDGSDGVIAGLFGVLPESLPAVLPVLARVVALEERAHHRQWNRRRRHDHHGGAAGQPSCDRGRRRAVGSIRHLATRTATRRRRRSGPRPDRRWRSRSRSWAPRRTRPSRSLRR